MKKNLPGRPATLRGFFPFGVLEMGRGERDKGEKITRWARLGAGLASGSLLPPTACLGCLACPWEGVDGVDAAFFLWGGDGCGFATVDDGGRGWIEGVVPYSTVGTVMYVASCCGRYCGDASSSDGTALDGVVIIIERCCEVSDGMARSGKGSGEDREMGDLVMASLWSFEVRRDEEARVRQRGTDCMGSTRNGTFTSTRRTTEWTGRRDG